MPFGKEEDIVNLVRGNDGSAYLYVTRKDGQSESLLVVRVNGCASLCTLGLVGGFMLAGDELVWNSNGVPSLGND